MTDWNKVNYIVSKNTEMAFEDYFGKGAVQQPENLQRFLTFAIERMNVFNKKQAGEAPPWTKDEVLTGNKFTNCYRILDRVSQYLLREIICPYYTEEHDMSLSELFCQIYIFKMFNRIEIWEAIPEEFRDKDNKVRCENKLCELELWGLDYSDRTFEPLFSNAYLMCKATEKHNFSRLTLYMDSLEKILHATDLRANWATIMSSDNLQQRYEILSKYFGFGPFLAYQFAMDFSYAAPMRVDLDEFVVPGPGCMRGMQKVFGADLHLASDYVRILKMMGGRQIDLFKMHGLTFPYLQVNNYVQKTSQYGNLTLKGLAKTKQIELLAVSDFQNLFCEFDKYSRVAYPDMAAERLRKKIKNKYDFNHAYKPQEIVLPPSWYSSEV